MLSAPSPCSFHLVDAVSVPSPAMGFLHRRRPCSASPSTRIQHQFQPPIDQAFAVFLEPRPGACPLHNHLGPRLYLL
ncbi:hypothetical protein M0R45_036112 [Rubus argutus]|uniref:Uncharacterized protein n=1 Tax=Rubus argutus TaxID=59490 RepID=A0AAW1VW46_RUBAR